MNSERFRSIFSPTDTRLPAYVFGSMALGIFINWIFSLVAGNTPAGLVLSLALSAIAFFFAWRGNQHQLRWSSGNLSERYEGIITLLSTPDTIKTLLEHHRGKLRHIWIITNFKEAPYSNFFSNDLPKLINNANTRVEHHPIHFDDDHRSNTQETYESVKRAVSEALNQYGLSNNQIVVDITSGTKEMAVGMIMACIENNWNMSYVRSEYTWINEEKRSQRIQGSEKVLTIEYSFGQLK